MKCTIEEIDLVDLTVYLRRKAPCATLMRVPVTKSKCIEVFGFCENGAFEVELSLSDGEVLLNPCIPVESAGEDDMDAIPTVPAPMSKRMMTAAGSRLMSMSEIMLEHGLIPKDLPTYRRSTIVTTLVWPRMQEIGLITPIRERIDPDGTMRKVRWFTNRGSVYGFTKKMLPDISGRKTISRGHVFYSHKADELLQLLGDEMIAKIKETSGV